jgi:hypothetical protein
VGDDGFADIGLPDAHLANAVTRHPLGVDESAGDRKRADRGGEITAVAAPVDESPVDRNLAEQVVDVVMAPPIPSVCLP